MVNSLALPLADALGFDKRVTSNGASPVPSLKAATILKSTLKSTAGRGKSLSVETIEPTVAAKLIESGKATGPMVVDGCLDLSASCR